MTDFSRSAVDAAIARRIEEGLAKILDEPAAAKSFPVQIGVGMIRSAVRALRGDGQQPAPVRKLAVVGRFDLVQTSGRIQAEERVESAFANREPDPDPACLAAQLMETDDG